MPDLTLSEAHVDAVGFLINNRINALQAELATLNALAASLLQQMNPKPSEAPSVPTAPGTP